jgi:outer membrane protein
MHRSKIGRIYGFKLSGKRAVVIVSMAILDLAFSAARAESTNRPPVTPLKLDDYLQQVLQHNESVQAQMLEAESMRRKEKGEYGIFEPSLAGSVTREANRRLNNAQEAAASSGLILFDEQNNIYDSAIEQLIPTGGKVRLGYTLSDLRNNYPYNGGFITNPTNNVYTKQYQTFVGATLTQPLLKGAGFTATLAGIRLAALDSDIAFEQYRRQLMLTIYQAEGAYWNLYFAQEQIRFFDESVSVANDVLADTREKVKAGQGAELDVMEAQSALALRDTKRNDAVQNYYDALGHLQILTGTSPSMFTPPAGEPQLRAVDDPHSTNSPPVYGDIVGNIYLLNPEYLIQQKKTDEEMVRLGYAKNQLLPELNLKAAYGFNGLANSPGDSWDSTSTQDFPSWSIGVEFNIPLGGNIKGRNYYKAAQLSLREALMNLKGTQNEIANGLNIAIQKAQAWHQSIQSYQTVVSYNEELLKTQLERLKAGAVEGTKVLDTEANLLDSRQDLAGALTQYRRALLEVELSSGTLLKNRDEDLTRDELKHQTQYLLNHGDVAQVKPIHRQTTASPLN